MTLEIKLIHHDRFVVGLFVVMVCQGSASED